MRGKQRSGRAHVVWIILVILISFAFLSSQASACIFTGHNQLGIIFRPDSGVNTTLLNEYCEPNSCILSDSNIIYQSHYDPRVGVIISKRDIRNPELSNINILGTWSTNLRDITGEETHRCEIRVDVTNLSNHEIIELSSQELPQINTNGYLLEERINDLRSKYHSIIINFSGEYGYGEYDRKTFIEECDNALSKYKKIIKPASITEVYQLGIVVPENGTKFNSLSFRVNVRDLSNSQILDLIQNAPEKWDIRDYFGYACAVGMNCLKYGLCNLSTECLLSSDEKITEAKSENHTKVSFSTAAPLYTTEDEAIKEVKEFLENYDLELPQDIHGEVAPSYTVSLDDFNWSAAISLELKTLLSNGVLYGIQDKEIDAIGVAVTRPGTFIYFKPSGCGNSYLCSIYNNSDESGWLVGVGNCDIDKYENNCPKIECYECGPVLPILNLPASPINLQVPGGGVVNGSEEKGVLGFEAIFAIAGLLTMAYLLRRRG